MWRYLFDQKSGKKEKGREEQLVVANLYTKFEVSILNGCGDIFDEKFGEKEKRTNKGKNKYEKAHFPSHNTTCRCEPVHKI